jgi:hypothetical protein
MAYVDALRNHRPRAHGVANVAQQWHASLAEATMDTSPAVAEVSCALLANPTTIPDVAIFSDVAYDLDAAITYACRIFEPHGFADDVRSPLVDVFMNHARISVHCPVEPESDDNTFDA